MRAIVIESFGDPSVLVPKEIERPRLGPADALVRIRATAINRADVLQRRGHYPAPPDALKDVPGLEFAGEVEEVGPNVTEVSVGDRVYGLAGGGTYADYIAVNARTLSRIPRNLGFNDAAAIPEAFITAYDAAVVQGELKAGEYFLITAVGSGVGSAAVQIANAIGAIPIGTARSGQKLEQAREIGLQHGVLTLDGEYAEEVLDASGGAGVNVVLELVGGNYVLQDIVCCASKGRIMIVGLVGGAKVEADLAAILRKRLTVRGTTLRMRPLEEKILASRLLANNLNPLFESGKLKPVIDVVYKLEEASKAHAYMEANENFGKIILEV